MGGYTDEYADEYISGRNSVLEALKAGRSINRVLIGENINRSFAGEIEGLCKGKGIPFIKADKRVLDKLAGPDNRGIAAQIAPAAYISIEDILARAKAKGEEPLLIILSQVEDPHNLGAIMRTAYSAGAHGIIIPKRRAASLNQTVFKVAQGAAEYLPVARVANLVQAAQQLKQAGLWLIAADMNGDNFWDVDFSGPLALILGGEGKGIPPLLLKNCDFSAKIPMLGQISSLNVSAAAAILLYEAVKRRIC